MNQFSSRKRELVQNLLRLFKLAQPSEVVAGLDWYPKAHQIMLEWSDAYSLPIACVACVTASLSPQLEWLRNLVVADDILADRAPTLNGVLLSNVYKAQAIRRDRATEVSPYFKSAPKVTSFAKNLAGDSRFVTVDTHGLQAALNDVETRICLKWGPYTTIAECYAIAAHKQGLPPSDFQAVIWHVWKRLHPRASKTLRRRQWHVMGELED